MTFSGKSTRLGLAGVLLVLLGTSSGAQEDDSVRRGAYLAAAAGCGNCHTDSAHNGIPFAGGTPMPVAYGTLYAPNISPDPNYGIGKWTDAQFIRAMREGVGPDGRDSFPESLYPYFTLMSDADLLAIKAYLFSQTPVPQPNRDADVSFPHSWRFLQVGWRILYLREGPYIRDPTRGEEWNRGNYLAHAVAHCGGCHTPRMALGAVDKSRRFAGAPDSGGRWTAPNISSADAALGQWSTEDIARYLEHGVTPYGDIAGPEMTIVLRGIAQLSDDDRHALAVFVKSMPAQPAAAP
jgi:mono/diheme cytochrome c family protein